MKHRTPCDNIFFPPIAVFHSSSSRWGIEKQMVWPWLQEEWEKVLAVQHLVHFRSAVFSNSVSFFFADRKAL